MTAKDALEYAKKNNAVACDIKFMDFLGTWQHFTIPMSEYDEALFEEQLEIRIAAEYVFTVSETSAAAGPHQAEARVLSTNLLCRVRLRRRISKRHSRLSTDSRAP